MSQFDRSSVKWSALVVIIIIGSIHCLYDHGEKVVLVMAYKKFDVLRLTLENLVSLPEARNYHLVVTQSGTCKNLVSSRILIW